MRLRYQTALFLAVGILPFTLQTPVVAQATRAPKFHMSRTQAGTPVQVLDNTTVNESNSTSIELLFAAGGEFDYVLRTNNAHLKFGYGATITLTGLSGIKKAVFRVPRSGDGRLATCFRLRFTDDMVALTQAAANVSCECAGFPAMGTLAVFSTAAVGAVEYNVQADEGPFSGRVKGPAAPIPPMRQLRLIKYPHRERARAANRNE